MLKKLYEAYDSNERLAAKLKAGRSGFDVVFPSSHFMAGQIKGGVLKKLDKSRLTNWQSLDPRLLDATAVNDPGNEYGFPYAWGTTGIGYNVKKVRAILGSDQPLDSWELIFNPDILAKLSTQGVAVVDSAPEMLSIALHYLGLPHHSTQVGDYKKAENLLRQMRRHVSYFHASKYAADLARGDVCLVVGFSGDVLEAAKSAAEAGNGVQIEYVVPREGVPTWFDMVAIPTDAPNEDASYAFMNYLLRPAVLASVANAVDYANGRFAADVANERALKTVGGIYPSPEVFERLYAMEAIPPNVARLRARIWKGVMTGK